MVFLLFGDGLLVLMLCRLVVLFVKDFFKMVVVIKFVIIGMEIDVILMLFNVIFKIDCVFLLLVIISGLVICVIFLVLILFSVCWVDSVNNIYCFVLLLDLFWININWRVCLVVELIGSVCVILMFVV